MTAEIIQFIPKPNPDRLTSEELALATIAIFGTDPMRELIPYEAPEKDPA